jgi:hypothetical protein
MEQVEQLRIDIVDIPRAEVPKKMVDRRQGVGQIRALVEILDRQPLTGVRVREAQRARPRGFGSQSTGMAARTLPRNVRREHVSMMSTHYRQRAERVSTGRTTKQKRRLDGRENLFENRGPSVSYLVLERRQSLSLNKMVIGGPILPHEQVQRNRRARCRCWREDISS